MLTANQQEINLGVMKYGQSYSFKYLLTNNFKGEITITKIIRGCSSCTEATLSKSKLQPGDHCTVDVVFTPGSTGAARKQISVLYDVEGRKEDIILKFKGNVE